MVRSYTAAHMEDFKEVAKGRFSEEAIEFMYRKFIAASPEGMMTPLQFKTYMDRPNVFKHQRGRRSARGQLAEALTDAPGAAVGSGGATTDGLAMEPKAPGLLETVWNWLSQPFSTPQAYLSDNRQRAAKVARLQSGPMEMYLHLFRAFDVDGDGIITFKEFLMFHMGVMFNTEELFHLIFSAFDDDQDGVISAQDIQTVVTNATRWVGDVDVDSPAVRRVIAAEVARLMGFLDIRQEGRIRRADMRLITQRHPEILEKMKHLM